MFDGDIENGELEIGQVAGLIKEIKPVSEIMDEVIAEFHLARAELETLNFV